MAKALALPHGRIMNAGGPPPSLLNSAVMELRPGRPDRMMPKPISSRIAFLPSPLWRCSRLRARRAPSLRAQCGPTSSAAPASTPRGRRDPGLHHAIGSSGYTGNNLAIVYSNRGIAHARAATTIVPSPTSTRPCGSIRATLAPLSSRGNAQLAKRDFERAITSFDQAIRLDPEMPEACLAAAPPMTPKATSTGRSPITTQALRSIPTLGAPISTAAYAAPPGPQRPRHCRLRSGAADQSEGCRGL